MNHWLVKSEPDVYGYDQLVAEGRGRWDGVRNYQARNNLRAMQVGDLCLFYHSNIGLAVVGISRVVQEYYPDPTAELGDWSCVELEPVKPGAQRTFVGNARVFRRIFHHNGYGSDPTLKHDVQ